MRTIPGDTRRHSYLSIIQKDLVALYLGDPAVTTSKGRKIIELLREYYPRFEELERHEFKGPNKTTIYAMSHPGDNHLFDVQLRRKLRKNCKQVQEVSEARNANVHLLERLKRASQGVLFTERERDPDYFDFKGLSHEETRALRSLAHWRLPDGK